MKLRKTFVGLLTVLASCGLVTTVVGCDSNDEPPVVDQENEDEKIVTTAMDNVTVAATATENFSLPTSAAGGVIISWASSTPANITISGQNATVTRPVGTDVEVTLTATFKLNDVTKTKTYKVTVTHVAEDDIITVAAALASADSTNVKIKGVVTGVVQKTSADGDNVAFAARGYWVTDETGTIYVANADNVKKGDLVVVSGPKTTDTRKADAPLVEIYGSGVECVVAESNKPFPEIVATETTLSALLAMTEPTTCGKVFKFSARIEVYKNTSGGYVNFSLYDPTTNEYIGEYADTYDKNLALDATYPEFADYYNNDGITATVYFAIQGKTSSGKWRGNLLAVTGVTDMAKAQAKVDNALDAVSATYIEAGSFDLPTDVTFTVPANDYVSIADGKLVVVLPTDADATVELTASATVGSDTASSTKTLTIQVHQEFTPWQKYINTADGEAITTPLTGYVTAVGFKNDADATKIQNIATITTPTGSVYVFARGFTQEAWAAKFVVGKTVTLTAGEKDLYNGLHEYVVKDLTTVTVTDAAVVTPTAEDVTTLVSSKALTADEWVAKQGSLVSVTGVLSFEGTNKFLTVNDKKIQIYLDSKFATVNSSSWKEGNTYKIEGIVSWYSKAQITPVKSDCFTLVAEGETPDPTPTPEGAASLKFSEKYSADTAVDGVSIEFGGVTVSFAKNEGSNDPKYFLNGTSLRLYKQNTMTFTSTKAIEKIEFTYTLGNFTAAPDFITASVGTLDLSTTTAGSWTGSATEVVFTNITEVTSKAPQWRILTIVVTFAE